MACSYCNHNKARRENACDSLNTPYRDRKIHGYNSIDLTDEQLFRGCLDISYDGNKIRIDLFKIIPTDSALRILPFDQIVDPNTVDLLAPQADITAKLTAAELASGKEWW